MKIMRKIFARTTIRYQPVCTSRTILEHFSRPERMRFLEFITTTVHWSFLQQSAAVTSEFELKHAISPGCPRKRYIPFSLPCWPSTCSSSLQTASSVSLVTFGKIQNPNMQDLSLPILNIPLLSLCYLSF